jgi:hypothetical protein
MSAAAFYRMPSTQTVPPPVTTDKVAKDAPKLADIPIARRHAVEEIQAYIVIRDGLLSEAEKKPTSELLRRLSIANDFVENCLKPARSPYEAQCLPEIDAARERQQCQTVRVRIAELGGQSSRNFEKPASAGG